MYVHSGKYWKEHVITYQAPPIGTPRFVVICFKNFHEALSTTRISRNSIYSDRSPFRNDTSVY